MQKFTATEAAQKLVKMVSVSEFTEDVAYGYVEVFLDIECGNERDYIEDLEMDNLMDAISEDGWLM